MNRITHPTRIVAALGALALAGIMFQASTDASPVADSASYRVVFVPSWNPTTHAADYPITHGKKGLLTPIIGATHGTDFQLFAAGMKPTPGLERLSEMGMHDPLNAEIKHHIKSGKVGALITFADASPGPVHPPVTHTFVIDSAHSRVSLAGMIAPSPDWFYGVSSVELRRDGDWVSSLSVDAFAWDSGGDTGAAYMAEDADAMPKEGTRLLDNEIFRPNGVRAPVGTFVFTRVPNPGM